MQPMNTPCLLFATESFGLSPPAVMALICGLIFLALKGVALAHYERRELRPLTLGDRLAWFFTWPGMNPRDFFELGHVVEKPARRAWLWAIAKILFGTLLFGLLASWVVVDNALLGGWIAMVGLIFLLHFGVLHLSALFWRRAGREVEPIMRAPVLAKSLDEFWSRRWNLAFRDFASSFIFRPLHRRFGRMIAVMGSFAFSGFVHDLGISVPARGGYGLPTAYFLLQGIGVLFERSRWGQRLGLGKGWRGWLFAAAITAPAAFFLFHPPFVREVILPLLPS